MVNVQKDDDLDVTHPEGFSGCIQFLKGGQGGAPTMLEKLGLYSCTIFDLSACAESARETQQKSAKTACVEVCVNEQK